MALDAAILARVREWVGSAPDDAAIETTYGLSTNGTVDTTALSILRTRRADLMTSRSWGLPGDYYEGATSLSNLDSAIAQLEGLVGTGSSVLQTATLSRGCGGR